MHFNTGLTLTTVSVLLGMTSSAAIDARAPDDFELLSRAAAQPWSFKAYTGKGCVGSSNTYSGNGQIPCQPPKPAYQSVLVTSLANGDCILGFSNVYNASNTKGCGNYVGTSPGVASINKCYDFPAGKIPTTYVALCRSPSS